MIDLGKPVLDTKSLKDKIPGQKGRWEQSATQKN